MARQLTLKQQRFVQALTDPSSPTFGNQTKSYQVSHPRASYNAASVEASKNLDKPKIVDAISQELTAQGVTKEWLEGELLWNVQASRSDADKSNHRAAVETLAKLRGDWKERQEVTHLDEQTRNAIREQVSTLLKQN